MSFGERATKNGEILGENADCTAMNATRPGDHAIAERSLLFESEIRGTMSDKYVYFFKRIRVEQKIESLTSRQFSFFVSIRDFLLSAT